MDTTEKYLSCKETAALVRQQLKACFPGQKFSVRSDTYSGGASVRVSWVDGPTEKEVDAAVRRYERSWFDGMVDMKHYHEPTLVSLPGEELPVLVRFGADYVTTSRELSPGYAAQLHEAAAELVKRQFGRETYDRDERVPEFHTEFGYVHAGGTGHHLAWFLSLHVRPGQSLAQAEAEHAAAETARWA